MKLKDLIDSYNWETISNTFLQCYPRQEDQQNLPGYQEVFATLQTLEPETTRLQLLIENIADEPDQFVASVSGQDETGSYGIEFMDWRERLGMEVRDDMLEQFPQPEIIVYCLWEMTFFGYDQEPIQAKLHEWSQRPKGEKTLSSEQVRRELGLEE